MAMQNLTAALHNEQLKELFSNCSYKCFLDQGGVDANALAEIQELSRTEFNALNSDQVGCGVMVWGKKVILFDAKVSRQNSIYDAISTNFHEKSEDIKKKSEQEKENQTVVPENVEDKAGIRKRNRQIILQMSGYQDVSLKDILGVVDNLTPGMAEDLLEELLSEGKIVRVSSRGEDRYRKAG